MKAVLSYNGMLYLLPLFGGCFRWRLEVGGQVMRYSINRQPSRFLKSQKMISKHLAVALTLFSPTHTSRYLV
jgi:hypothetical protein